MLRISECVWKREFITITRFCSVSFVIEFFVFCFIPFRSIKVGVTTFKKRTKIVICKLAI